MHEILEDNIEDVNKIEATKPEDVTALMNADAYILITLKVEDGRINGAGATRMIRDPNFIMASVEPLEEISKNMKKAGMLVLMKAMMGSDDKPDL